MTPDELQAAVRAAIDASYWKGKCDGWEAGEVTGYGNGRSTGFRIGVVVGVAITAASFIFANSF